MGLTPNRGRRRLWRGVEGAGVYYVGIPAALVFVAALLVIGNEGPRSSWLTRLYSAAGLFAGNYLPVTGQGSPPSPLMAALGVAALGLTFVAALTAVLATTARARERFRARRAGTQLVVLGNGPGAAELVRQHTPSCSRGVLLVTEGRQTPAALAAAGRASIQVADLDALDEETVASLRRRGGRIVVAGDDDAATLDLAYRLNNRMGQPCPVVAVLGHAALVDELRPAVISGDSVDTFGVSCPAENTAGRVCQELERLWRADIELGAVGRGSVLIQGDDSDLTETVLRWVRRASWARSMIVDEHGTAVAQLAPRVDVGGSHLDDETVVYRVVVGAHGGDVAARALQLIRRGSQEPRRMVAVTSNSLLPSTPGLGVTVVDPRVTAWDRELVFETTTTTWGRLFHSAYGAAFNDTTLWSEVAGKREGQSSVAAAQFLPRNLAAHGFQLVRVDGQPRPPTLSQGVLTSLAAAEHHDWLQRTWQDEHGVVHSVVKRNSPYDRSWAELTEEDRERNRTLLRGAAAALPALLGYEVQRTDQR